jgi:hypothetical protein
VPLLKAVGPVFRKSSGAIVIAAGVLVALRIQAEQASLPGDQPSPARILLKIGTRYSIERSEFNKSLSATRWGFIDEQGKVVIEPKYDAVSESAEGIIPVKENDRWGWIDQTGSHIDAQLSAPAEFHEGVASFNRNGKAGFIDPTGKVVIEPQWERAGNFNEGLASIVQNGRYGYIDKTGKVVIEPRWEMAGDFREGMAGVKEKDKWGYIDKTGKMVIKPEWDDSMQFVDGYAVVFRNHKGGVIDKQGKIVVPLEWDTIWPCSLVLEPNLQYDVAPEVFDARETPAPNQKKGCCDKTGKIVADPNFEKQGGFSHRLDPRNEGDKWGLIDGTKRFVVEPQWEIIIPHQIANDQVYWLLAREDKSSKGKSVLVEWRDPKGKKIWSSVESATR